MPETPPLYIDQDVDTRVVVENRDGVLVALVQRRAPLCSECGHPFDAHESTGCFTYPFDGEAEWTTFGEASGANGTILIRPA